MIETKSFKTYEDHQTSADYQDQNRTALPIPMNSLRSPNVFSRWQGCNLGGCWCPEKPLGYGHQAIVRLVLDVLQLLLDSGADVNKQARIYGFPLLAAATHGYQAIVRLLLHSGADINVSTRNGKSIYECEFKLADLGLSHFRPKIGQNAKSRDAQGTRTYGAPECYRSDSFILRSNLRVSPKVDIWSLGCVFSEAAEWVGHGMAGLETYRRLCEEETDRIPGFRDSGCFHNSETDVNIFGIHYGKALRAAVEHGHQGIVRLLPDRAGLGNIRQQRGWEVCDRLYLDGLGNIRQQRIWEFCGRLDRAGLGNIRQQRKWEVCGRLSGVHVTAFPDSGSDLDIISERFAIRNGLRFDPNFTCSVKLPMGNETRSLGTVSLPFSFEGEKTEYRRVFHVLRRPIHDVILSNDFLKVTKTLTKNIHRIKEKLTLCSSSARQVLFLGSPKQKFLGSINGHAVHALPDTGSDVMLISRHEAERLGLPIHTGHEYQTRLEFADGSHAHTSGMVLDAEWRYGAASLSKTFHCDFHVLDNLSCDVILSNDFVFDTQAFSRHKESLYDSEHLDDSPKLSLIQMKRRPVIQAMRDFLHSLRGRSKSNNVIISGSSTNSLSDRGTDRPLTRTEEEEEELHRQGEAEDHIAALSQQDQAAAREMEDLRRAQWRRDHPPIPPTVPQISSSAGHHPTGSAAPVAPPPDRRSRWTIRLARRKRNRCGSAWG